MQSSRQPSVLLVEHKIGTQFAADEPAMSRKILQRGDRSAMRSRGGSATKPNTVPDVYVAGWQAGLAPGKVQTVVKNAGDLMY